jgi:hypothetical protein
MVAELPHPLKETGEMTIASKIRNTIAVLGATAAALAVGLPTAQADAAIGSMTANLSITPAESGYKWVHVHGNVPMSQVEAQSLINERHNVVVRLYGEDTFSDDLLMGPYTAVSGANYDGLWFSIAHKVRNSLLNEDWGTDEIYAGVRLLKPTGDTLRSDETNRVTGSF